MLIKEGMTVAGFQTAAMALLRVRYPQAYALSVLKVCIRHKLCTVEGME
jgi:hypothetical protein